MTHDEKSTWVFLYVFFGIIFWFAFGGVAATHGQVGWPTTLLLIVSTILVPMNIIWFIRLAFLAGRRRGRNGQ